MILRTNELTSNKLRDLVLWNVVSIIMYVAIINTYFRERTQETTQLEANIQHLKPGATYTFRVVAYNNAGASPTAAQIRANTDPECTYNRLLTVYMGKPSSTLSDLSLKC
jgi:hypothetical protein